MTRDHPAPKRIRLVLADVDGTLVTKDKVLTPRAMAAVHALHARGIDFAVTSGRPPKGMAMLVEPLALRTPISGFNGGLVVEPDLATVLESRTLPRAAAEETLALLDRLGLDAWVYSGEDWLIRDKDAPHVAREAGTVKFDARVVPAFEGGMLDHVVKVVVISDDLELVRRAEAEAQRALGQHASAARSQPYYLDVTHPEANKGGAIAWLSRHLGIPQDEIATLGDQPNDVLMFRPSGLAIAMGNASAEVQAEADRVTASYEDEGFARAVEEFILPLAGDGTGGKADAGTAGKEGAR